MSSNSKTADLHPGMMGDGTEEQNLNQRGNPKARITQDDVEAAFGGSDRWSALKDRGAVVRESVANSAEAVRGWAADQAVAARKTTAEKPLLVVSVSAGTALAVGLAVGFLIGRASDY